MNTTLPTRPKMDDRLFVNIPADQKRRLFEIAASRGVTTAEMIREALASAIAKAA